MLHFNNNLLEFEGWEEGAFLTLVVRKGNEVLSVKKEKNYDFTFITRGFSYYWMFLGGCILFSG